MVETRKRRGSGKGGEKGKGRKMSSLWQEKWEVSRDAVKSDLLRRVS